MVAYSIPKWHHTSIADIDVARDPYPVDWLRSAEKSCSWACACVLDNGLSQVKSIPIAELFSQRPVGSVFVVVYE